MTAAITHPDKVLFPDDGITKGDLAHYYEAMAPFILPDLRGRPITMERYPAGINAAEAASRCRETTKGLLIRLTSICSGRRPL